MEKALLVMIGGSLGALLRYGTSLWAARQLGTGFAWGTLIVNLAGCLLIGISFELADRRGIMSPSARLFFVTGFLGALTTFSTYALETVNYAREQSMANLAMNALLNNLVGGSLVVVGMWIAARLT